MAASGPCVAACVAARSRVRRPCSSSAVALGSTIAQVDLAQQASQRLVADVIALTQSQKGATLGGQAGRMSILRRHLLTSRSSHAAGFLLLPLGLVRVAEAGMAHH